MDPSALRSSGWNRWLSALRRVVLLSPTHIGIPLFHSVCFISPTKWDGINLILSHGFSRPSQRHWIPLWFQRTTCFCSSATIWVDTVALGSQLDFHVLTGRCFRFFSVFECRQSDLIIRRWYTVNIKGRTWPRRLEFLNDDQYYEAESVPSK